MGVRPMAHPFPPPGPATTPGRSMPVLIGHTARPVRRIFPSWQLLPAQLVVSYLRVNAREKTKSGVVRGCQLQLRTWWVCLPAAWTAATILWSQTTPSPALAFPRRLSRLSQLPPGVVSDHAPRLPATFGRRIHWLQRRSVHMDIALSQLPPRQSGRSATPICSSRFAIHTTGRWCEKGGRASGYKRAVLVRAHWPLGGHQQGCDGRRSVAACSKTGTEYV